MAVEEAAKEGGGEAPAATSMALRVAEAALTDDEAFDNDIMQTKGARRARRLKSRIGRDARKLVA